VNKYKVHHFEFCTTHFASSDQSYLQEIKGRLVHTRSAIVNMPVDVEELWGQGGLSDPGTMDPKNLERTAESYKALVNFAAPKDVHVIIENHGGVGSEHPEELV